ncbi:MAG: zinc ribbon domain-containing protein [Promethearchaeia archaeon]
MVRILNTGGYLAFWQTHWFFSQVQEAVKLQAYLRHISFRTVNAAYTSQNCWECGQRGTLTGKSFTCRNVHGHTSKCPVYLQSDLNAARNIALA